MYTNLSSRLLRSFVLQVPDTVFVCRGIVEHSDLRSDPQFEAGHVEEQVRVVLTIHTHEAVVPVESSQRARKSTLPYTHKYTDN